MKNRVIGQWAVGAGGGEYKFALEDWRSLVAATFLWTASLDGPTLARPRSLTGQSLATAEWLLFPDFIVIIVQGESQTFTTS